MRSAVQKEALCSALAPESPCARNRRYEHGSLNSDFRLVSTDCRRTRILWSNEASHRASFWTADAMTQLTYLVDEDLRRCRDLFLRPHCGQYLKTAFILCYDYTELTRTLPTHRRASTGQIGKTTAGSSRAMMDVQKDVRTLVQASAWGISSRCRLYLAGWLLGEPSATISFIRLTARP